MTEGRKRKTRSFVHPFVSYVMLSEKNRPWNEANKWLTQMIDLTAELPFIITYFSCGLLCILVLGMMGIMPMNPVDIRNNTNKYTDLGNLHAGCNKRE